MDERLLCSSVFFSRYYSQHLHFTCVLLCGPLYLRYDNGQHIAAIVGTAALGSTRAAASSYFSCTYRAIAAAITVFAPVDLIAC